MRAMNFLLLVWLMVFPCFAQEDVFGQMGLPVDDARDMVLESLFSGSIPHQIVARAFLAAPVSTRIAWVRGVFKWARTYTGTQSFLQEYQSKRESDAPSAGEQVGSFDDELVKQQREFEKQVGEMRKNLKQMPADMRPQLEQTIRDMEKQFKEQFANPEYRALMAQGHEAMKAERIGHLERRQQEFEQSHPPDPRQLISRHLKNFINLCADIDFTARTEMRDGVRKFIDPVHESKSREWKLLYRAGRETVAAALSEAKAWLAAIPAGLKRP